jgi:hypothetical protein
MPRPLITTPARSQPTAVDQTGDAIVSLLERAAAVAKEDFDRAIAMSQDLSLQLRAAQDRSESLELQVRQLQEDARKAEDWLKVIYAEIESKFFDKRNLKNRLGQQYAADQRP